MLAMPGLEVTVNSIMTHTLCITSFFVKSSILVSCD